jgi:hypothetical protein
MANRLILRDRRDDPWGNVEARIIWSGGGQDRVWVNSNGLGEFNGSGNVKEVQVAGEYLPAIPSRVDGSTTIVAISNNAH